MSDFNNALTESVQRIVQAKRNFRVERMEQIELERQATRNVFEQWFPTKDRRQSW